MIVVVRMSDFRKGVMRFWKLVRRLGLDFVSTSRY